MKLVREHINEKFTDDSDPIEDMGIGSRHVIIQWFKDIGISPLEYTINKKLQITVKSLDLIRNVNITELPDNLHIMGFLDLEKCINITKLPKNLKVEGWLDIRGTKISELPDDLIVIDWIDVSEFQKKHLIVPNRLKRKITS